MVVVTGCDVVEIARWHRIKRRLRVGQRLLPGQRTALIRNREQRRPLRRADARAAELGPAACAKRVENGKPGLRVAVVRYVRRAAGSDTEAVLVARDALVLARPAATIGPNRLAHILTRTIGVQRRAADAQH